MTTAVASEIAIRPQKGLQEKFLSTKADIAIGGGAAGSGKSYALLLEPLYHVGDPNFGAVIFRRITGELTNIGGLWQEASNIYPHLLSPAIGRENYLDYRFPSGAVVKFAHMQHTKDRLAWKGAQVPLICFDQLEEFHEEQFWYLLSRNRSATANVKPYIRATCNPVPDDDKVGGWLHKFISWWIDEETGFPILERSGVLRWFVRLANEIHWGNTPEDLHRRFPEEKELKPKSVTFIPGTLKDNPILTQQDPSYYATLMALPLVERERLLLGNWKIRETAGTIFNRAWFGILREWPKDSKGKPQPDVKEWVRYWDKAGTEGGGKFSAGALVGKRSNGRFIIADMVRGQWSALNREKVIKQTAELDRERYGNVEVWQEQEPGSGGKESAEATTRNLAGFTIRTERVTGDKVARASPLSAQVEAENVDLLLAEWNEDYLSEAQNFDGVTGYTDQIDSSGGAFNKLTQGPKPVKQRKAVWG